MIADFADDSAPDDQTRSWVSGAKRHYRPDSLRRARLAPVHKVDEEGPDPLAGAIFALTAIGMGISDAQRRRSALHLL